MPVTVKLGSPFRRHTGGADSIPCNVESVPQLFTELEQRFPGLTRHLLTETGEPRPFLNIYVNGNNPPEGAGGKEGCNTDHTSLQVLVLRGEEITKGLLPWIP